MKPSIETNATNNTTLFHQPHYQELKSSFTRPISESNFHEGECFFQHQVGLSEDKSSQLSQFVRNYMPMQHREFYEKMPFLLVSSMDEKERVWASIIVAHPPFLQESTNVQTLQESTNDLTLPYQAKPMVSLARTLDDRSIHIETMLLHGDPLQNNLKSEIPIGILGIEPHTRRRNRVNGRVKGSVAFSNSGINDHHETVSFLLEVDVTMGNCPKYIQAREWNWKDRRREEGYGNVSRGLWVLPSQLEEFISKSDAFFIASASKESMSSSSLNPTEHDRRQGLDVSHRGGKPGFVTVSRTISQVEKTEQTILEYPEYLGNFMFNTLGNIVTNPKVGLLFINFDNGDLLYMTGKAFVAQGFQSKPGAQHTVRFYLEEWIYSQKQVPFEWKYLSESIYNPQVQFQSSLSKVNSNKLGMDSIVVRCKDRKKETHDTVTYTFSTAVALGTLQKAGQYGTFLIDMGPSGVVERSWTLTSPGGAGLYEISITVKTKEGGLVSNYLYEHMWPEKELRLKGIEGTFTLEDCIHDLNETKYLVFIAGGIGITPFMSILRRKKLQQLQSIIPQLEKIHLIHVVRTEQDLVFRSEIEKMVHHEFKDVFVFHPFLTASHISEDWKGGRGRLSKTDLEKIICHEQLLETQVMMCGPFGFMENIENIMQEIGLEKGRLHSEQFNF
ncbi:hypothetical protein C9374_008479 [Naegleria lovaniensis]|uniref:FAD-binding FR-type domain-containing protein n=1 Tax=Naegleria lovaniensis TaxID=51637 RepID=A0AA88GKV0_NAELO|nr:uncharacterized protein C9374_008479 [Naegleria lovaniensis]KAG2378336.1 hypothetical protein C9374_008479 [Naegleria lovaniensis]